MYSLASKIEPLKGSAKKASLFPSLHAELFKLDPFRVRIFNES